MSITEITKTLNSDPPYVTTAGSPEVNPEKVSKVGSRFRSLSGNLQPHAKVAGSPEVNAEKVSKVRLRSQSLSGNLQPLREVAKVDPYTHKEAVKAVKNATKTLQELTEKIYAPTEDKFIYEGAVLSIKIHEGAVLSIENAKAALQELAENINARTLHQFTRKDRVATVKVKVAILVQKAEYALQNLTRTLEELELVKVNQKGEEFNPQTKPTEDAPERATAYASGNIKQMVVKIKNAKKDLVKLRNKIANAEKDLSKLRNKILNAHTIPVCRSVADSLQRVAEKIIDFVTTSPIFRAMVAGGVVGAGIGAAVGFGAGALPGLILGVIFGPFVVAWLTGYIAWYNEQDNDQDLNAERYSTSLPIPDSDQNTSTPVIQGVTAPVSNQPDGQVQQPNRQYETPLAPDLAEDLEEALRHCQG